MDIEDPKAYAVTIEGDAWVFERIIEEAGGRAVAGLPWFCAGNTLVVLPAASRLDAGLYVIEGHSCRIVEIYPF